MSLEWLVIRGSGIAAFSLLSATTTWGLLVSSKLLGRLVKAKPLTWFHESLAIGALIATTVHIGVLSAHEYLDFSWSEILIPGRSDWGPLPVALGIAAMYGLAVVAGSFYVKRWIGQRVWKTLHFASFGVFLSALLHGISAGTDTRAPLVLGLYLGSALALSVLLALRMSDRRSADTTRRAGQSSRLMLANAPPERGGAAAVDVTFVPTETAPPH